ncbi:ligase-associated DNA damage response DEXH box helicase [Flaviaesturariibacter flavus]|uniref:Ligase-associated DNA damage response DEXH box helicase n=1 Tax=Flaviaesturariibacter flavus TaxID=2502780 RepID=A0A4R1BK65_9BACT|nr:ligase-associated DNA damage response DEXH box helicase [Flaviaesturariibacter flavus]TCJ17770.1 ligase-associated DNA damage response DEXH box helicase [Flaviaesturariibacter flavus]
MPQRLTETPGYKLVAGWLAAKNFRPFAYQEEAWQHIIDGKSGLVNAPTGTGKTFSVFLGAVIRFINEHPDSYTSKSSNGLQLLWLTPLRALAKDIARAMEEVLTELGIPWKVGIRNGDTSPGDRAKQKRHMPEVLLITPESLHLLLAQKHYREVFKHLRLFAVDEWHELIGSKRGVQVELAISRIVGLRRAQPYRQPAGERKNQTSDNRHQTSFSVWGISATIGNLNEAMDVLLAPVVHALGIRPVIVRTDIRKQIEIDSILPDEIEKYPWAGHLGIRLAHKVLPILEESRTTLIFINTRGMSEQWYHTLLTIAPELSGAIALHHGSIDMELRTWVEEALHEGKLKAVVCTASLDLGVDFRPVETVIQVGSPKGVARFLQRAGRSGHQPDAVSRIYFLPTHSLELMEAAALKEAVKRQQIESREPFVLCYDVLTQYLCTLAVSDGFRPEEVLPEIRSTWCYRELTDDDFDAILHFITAGGEALREYDEYRKVEVEDGVYKINSRRVAMRHRMHIGTIVSDAMLKVKFLGGGYIGMIEEYFISRLDPGDAFTLAGRQLELVMIKDMTVIVRKSNKKKAIVPSWNGGRLPLSASLGAVLREQFDIAGNSKVKSQKLKNVPSEIGALAPLLNLQKDLSHIPAADELLIEQIETDDGFHLFVYPFEGRLVHEAAAALLAYRISKLLPITFSIAMNDYGFELLSDQPVPVDDSNVYALFSPDNLLADIQHSVNATEMARRKFRDIGVIGGLIFQGMPGEKKKARHLQSSAGLLFNVFNEYEPGNVLLRQAYQEVFDQQMEERRLRAMLERIQRSRVVLTFPRRLTPLCFPIKVDSMRENLTSEKLEDRIKKMQQQLER